MGYCAKFGRSGFNGAGVSRSPEIRSAGVLPLGWGVGDPLITCPYMGERVVFDRWW